MPKILVKGPEGITSVNVGGEQYNVNDKGLFEVEEGVLALLSPHGFGHHVETAADNAGETSNDTAATSKAAAKAAAKVTTKDAAADNAGA